jgi:HEPN domain-containing protein
VTRKDFQELASVRLNEAKILLRNRCWEGAYYLGGYAAECALKACIARQTRRHDFPDRVTANAVHTHDLNTLIKFADLDGPLKEAAATHPEFIRNWGIVREWWEQSRYERPSQAEAENLLKALGDRKNGVMRWLRQHW